MAKGNQIKPAGVEPATTAQKQWGIPDWRDPAGYQNYGKWDLDRWRWEFLRRKTSYRSDYMAAYLENVEIGLINPEEYEGHFFADGAEKYELSEYLNPAISEWGSDTPRWNDPLKMLVYPPDTSERWWQIRTLVFDLDKPIAPQLEAARSLLLGEQGMAKLRPEQQVELAYGAEYAGVRETPLDELLQALQYAPRAMKFSPNQWSLYLRVLDAAEANASLSKIAEILPPHMSSRDAKSAHNCLQQARELQVRF